MRRSTHVARLLLLLLCSLLAAPGRGQDTLRIGIIGLDTSHVPVFTKQINSDKTSGNLARMRVVAAFAGGSHDLAASRDRVSGYTEELKGLGIEIVDSIEALLPKVDAVLLESVDGRKHLEQVLPVFQASKPVFIDKPLASNLQDAIAIDLLSKKYNARWFSSSSLRFSPSIARYRDSAAAHDKVLGATAWSPCALEPTHSDLFWYGIHGVETLYTAMGIGCQQVTRASTDGTDVVVGTWDDGRIGVYRGIRKGKSEYGLIVFGEKAVEIGGKYEGYAPLVERIADFFLGGDAPVTTQETLELLTFMQAADVSKQRGGGPVQLSEVWQTALLAAQQHIVEMGE